MQVRLESTDFFPVGSVIVFDATHLPFGCSVRAYASLTRASTPS